MAPITPPPEKTESFLLDETGLYLFTNEQRRSRRLSIVVEKVALGPRVEYHNYSTPEPKAFWGYIQIVRRDSIVRTIPLEYRRQILYSWDAYELEPIEQLRCLVKDSTLLLFDTVVPLLLAAGGDAEQIGQDRANYILRNGQPRLIPEVPDTGIYYEIVNNRGARITLIWQDYLAPCENPAGKQFLQPPRATEKDESGPGGDGGGGTRPSEPPPEDRSSDPNSDNSAPPSDDDGEPPIPTPEEPGPEPIGYFMTVTVRRRQQFGPDCRDQGLQEVYANFVGAAGPGTVVNEPEFPGTVNWKIKDAAGNVRTSIFSGAIGDTCQDEIVSVVQEPYFS